MSHPVIKKAFDSWRKIQTEGDIPCKLDFRPNSLMGFIAHGFVFEKVNSGAFKPSLIGTEARHGTFFDLVGDGLPNLTLVDNPLEKVFLLDAILDLKFGCRLNYKLKTLRNVEFDYQILFLPMKGANGLTEFITGAAIPLADYDLLSDDETLIVGFEIQKLSFLDIGFGFPTLAENTVQPLTDIHSENAIGVSIH